MEDEFTTKIAIAEIQNGTIVPLPGSFATFTNLTDVTHNLKYAPQIKIINSKC